MPARFCADATSLEEESEGAEALVQADSVVAVWFCSACTDVTSHEVKKKKSLIVVNLAS